MATTDLKLEESGTLSKPGPIGRLLRLTLGLLCLYYVYGLITIWDNALSPAGSIVSLVWNGILPGLFLVSYVINIGFSRGWKKRPAFFSAMILLAVAASSYVQSGTVETLLLARVIQVWALYIFLHLGGAFVISAFIGTPGCEMRAFHHLFSLITKKPTKEHHCPVGPIGLVDSWEARQS